MTIEGEFVIDDRHPALAGHFPGKPVVPGVVVLDEALAILRANTDGVIGAVERAKFAAPLPVNATCQVRLRPRDDGLFAVECVADGTLVLSAVARAGDPTGAQ